MKTALLLSGHMRYFKECYSSLKRSILDVLNPDIYIHTWNETDRSMWNDRVGNNFDNQFIKDNDIKIKNIIVENWQQTEPIIAEKVNNMGHVSYFKPIRMFSMFYKMRQSFNMIMNEKYDLVIRARPDLFYVNILGNNFENLDSFIKIPQSCNIPRIAFKDLNLNFEVDSYLKEGQENVDSYFVGEPCDCGGLLDQFAIGDYESMRVYSCAYDYFDTYKAQGYNFSGPETTLKHHLESNNINIIRDNLKLYIMRNWKFL